MSGFQMTSQVLDLLEAIQSPKDSVRKNAEVLILQRYPDPQFPLALLSIADHLEIIATARQSALLILNRYVLSTWSPKFDEDFKGQIYLSEDTKAQIRAQVLAICTNEVNDDRKVKNAASLVATKIASVDFPESWPDLLPILMQILAGTGPDVQVHGALRMLSDLVETGFDDNQFFAIAGELIKVLQMVATNDSRKPITRALAMNAFRGCFGMLEMVMEDHNAAVKSFLDESLKGWMDFFLDTLKMPLPEPPLEEDERSDAQAPNYWRGMVALKLQVVKVGSQAYI